MLTYAIGAETTDLSTLYMNNSLYCTSKLVYENLVDFDNGEIVPGLAAVSYTHLTQAVRQSVDLMLDWMKSTQGYSALMMTIWPAVLIGVLPVGCLFYMNGSLSAPDFITIAILSLGIMGPRCV